MGGERQDIANEFRRNIIMLKRMIERIPRIDGVVTTIKMLETNEELLQRYWSNCVHGQAELGTDVQFDDVVFWWQHSASQEYVSACQPLSNMVLMVKMTTLCDEHSYKVFHRTASQILGFDQTTAMSKLEVTMDLLQLYWNKFVDRYFEVVKGRTLIPFVTAKFCESEMLYTNAMTQAKDLIVTPRNRVNVVPSNALPAPVAPVAAVAPVPTTAPVAPVPPTAPVAPVPPTAPVAPAGPVVPTAPVKSTSSVHSARPQVVDKVVQVGAGGIRNPPTHSNADAHVQVDDRRPILGTTNRAAVNDDWNEQARNYSPNSADYAAVWNVERGTCPPLGSIQPIEQRQVVHFDGDWNVEPTNRPQQNAVGPNASPKNQNLIDYGMDCNVQQSSSTMGLIIPDICDIIDSDDESIISDDKSVDLDDETGNREAELPASTMSNIMDSDNLPIVCSEGNLLLPKSRDANVVHSDNGSLTNTEVNVIRPGSLFSNFIDSNDEAVVCAEADLVVPESSNAIDSDGGSIPCDEETSAVRVTHRISDWYEAVNAAAEEDFTDSDSSDASDPDEESVGNPLLASIIAAEDRVPADPDFIVESISISVGDDGGDDGGDEGDDGGDEGDDGGDESDDGGDETVEAERCYTVHVECNAESARDSGENADDWDDESIGVISCCGDEMDSSGDLDRRHKYHRKDGELMHIPFTPKLQIY